MRSPIFLTARTIGQTFLKHQPQMLLEHMNPTNAQSVPLGKCWLYTHKHNIAPHISTNPHRICASCPLFITSLTQPTTDPILQKKTGFLQSFLFSVWFLSLWSVSIAQNTPNSYWIAPPVDVISVAPTLWLLQMNLSLTMHVQTLQWTQAFALGKCAAEDGRG